MSDPYQNLYSRPELRREINQDLMQSDKGGRREQLMKLKKDELLELAREHNISGRSSMRKVTLAKSLHEHFQKQHSSSNGVPK